MAPVQLLCVCECLVGWETTGCQPGLHGIVTLCMLCAAAGDDEGHAEDAFEDEDAEHASVSSSEPLAHRGQVCVTSLMHDIKFPERLMTVCLMMPLKGMDSFVGKGQALMFSST